MQIGKRMFQRTLLILSLLVPFASATDYGLALSKGLLYFEAQRSGKLPSDNRVNWRGDSCLADGSDVGKDLSRAYFDSGDHVVFGLPLSFTLTMMAYGLVEYGDTYGDSQGRAFEALKWGTDWLLRAHSSNDELYVQVGDGDKDHACWTRPEDMSMPRPSFKVNATSPGSEPSAEAAAAMAAASLVFKQSDTSYSKLLLEHAEQLFRFADSHRGKYSDSVPQASAFYKSYSGFGDELLWAAAWLHRATDDTTYLDYVKGSNDLGWKDASTEVSWDDKKAAAHILLSRLLLNGEEEAGSALDDYEKAASFVCAYVSNGVRKTAAGLAFVDDWLPLQYVTSSAFLIAVYGDYLGGAKGKPLQCSGNAYGTDDLLTYSKGQADYILGSNPLGISYMVGFGANYPRRVHHRAASIPQDGIKYACGEGFRFFQTADPNPNILEGAVVGGPDANDRYKDDRTRYQESEPSTYTTAPFLGLLARLSSKQPQSSPPPPTQEGEPSLPPPSLPPQPTSQPSQPNQPPATQPSQPIQPTQPTQSTMQPIPSPISPTRSTNAHSCMCECEGF